MQFRTVIPPVRTDLRIDHTSSVIMLGSCFSDNIGGKLKERMFNVAVNPLGTVYNPASIAAVTRVLVGKETISESDLFWHNGLWRHRLCHSSLAREDRHEALNAIHESLEQAHRTFSLNNGSGEQVAILTLGTARVFEQGGIVVANCHKLPTSCFTRRLLSVEEVTGSIREAACNLNEWLPGIRIVITVSPIRHLEAGLDGNSLSKAVLRLACEKYLEEDNRAVYFPSFEVMIDDLRDYRFYEADMKHPSDVAVEYIFNLFQESFMTDESRKISERVLALQRLMAHRPITADSVSAVKHAEKIASMRNSLLKEFPVLRRNG